MSKQDQELDWDAAWEHLQTVMNRYAALPFRSATPAMQITFRPLYNRFRGGERTGELHEAIMALE